MKNLKLYLILIILLVTIFFINTYYKTKIANTTFLNIMPSANRLTKRLVSNYFSEDKDLRISADTKIKEIILKDLEYDNWLDFLDYIELTLYPVDVLNDFNEDLIITINLSKDQGLIVIYKSIDDFYVYTSKIEDLSYVNGLSTLRRSNNGNIFIIVEEILDEKLGAFFFDQYLRVYKKENTGFTEVFRQSLDYQGYYYEKWSDPTIEKPKWYKVTEKNLVDYMLNEEGNILVNIDKTLSRYEGYSEDDSIPKNFELIDRKEIIIKYYWSDQYNYFIQGEGKIKSTEEIIGIIENSNQLADSLLGLHEPYYKVIHKNGKIEYIDINSLALMR